jgi:uncharacterized protein (TIGR00369 family)
MPSVRNFSDHVRASFHKQAIMKLLGAKITRLDRGIVQISAGNRPALGQQDGFVHAGALTTLVDSAGGYATLSLLPAGSRVLSVELKLNFLRPAIGTIIRGTGKVRKIGRTISVCEINAEMKQGRKWVECAWGIQTVYCIRNGQ